MLGNVNLNMQFQVTTHKYNLITKARDCQELLSRVEKFCFPYFPQTIPEKRPRKRAKLTQMTEGLLRRIELVQQPP